MELRPSYDLRSLFEVARRVLFLLVGIILGVDSLSIPFPLDLTTGILLTTPAGLTPRSP